MDAVETINKNKKTLKSKITKLCICAGLLNVLGGVVLYKKGIPRVMVEQMKETIYTKNEKPEENYLPSEAKLSEQKFLLISSAFEKQEDNLYRRNCVKYDISKMKQEEILDLVSEEKALIEFLANHKGHSFIEEKQTLTKEELENNNVRIEIYVYENDANYRKEEKTPIPVFVICTGVLGIITLSNFVLRKDIDRLSEEQILEGEGKLIKTLFQKKKEL